MTHNEARELAEKKLRDSAELIKNAKNGDLLKVITSISYIDSDFEEKDYEENGKLALLASLDVFSIGREGDDDPYYSLSFVIELNDGQVKEDFDSQIDEFDNDLSKFINALEASVDVEKFIESENERQLEDCKAELGNLEKKLNKHLVLTIGIAVIAILTIILINVLR